MKVRESGMPQESIWGAFFEPASILDALGVDSSVSDVAEFGCGYGTFTIPTAKMVSGKVYALDIDPEMIEATKRKAKENRIHTVETMLRDFVSDGSGLEDESVDYVMLFNILHAEEPKRLLKEAHRILRPHGKLGIVHWNYDPSTPRGPPMEIRPTPEQCIDWAGKVGFNSPRRYDLKPYHYGVVVVKT
ncbi:class I SAM-dependent methyltransferase [Candidatus Woesearchaeota archaeon]|nr:class I SAM-dependent methyltransferase [Candidatus Woesearchaeota archaeon]